MPGYGKVNHGTKPALAVRNNPNYYTAKNKSDDIFPNLHRTLAALDLAGCVVTASYVDAEDKWGVRVATKLGDSYQGSNYECLAEAMDSTLRWAARAEVERRKKLTAKEASDE